MSKPRRHIPAAKRSAKKIVTMNLRVEDTEKAAFDRCAEIAGIGLSAWVRERLRAVALRELDNVGEPAPFLSTGEPGEGNA